MDNNRMTWDSAPATLNTSQVSELLNLHPNTIRSMINESKLPAYKVGRVYRFDTATLHDWVTKQLLSD